MLRGNSHFHTVALGLVHQGFRKANIHPPKDTTTIYFPPAISQGRSVYLTSLLEWGWQNSVGFALGGHYEECGEDTLNRISEDLPIAVMARLRETNITSFSDIRVWDSDARAWEWPDNHHILDHHTSIATDFWGDVP